MKTTATLQPLILAAALLLTALSPAAAAGQHKPSAASRSEATISVLGLTSSVPESWRKQPPTTSSRLAQYAIPGKKPGQDAEFIVYFFGAGQGGTAEQNIIRWKGQFFGPNGAPVVPQVEKFKVRGMAVTTAEFQGTYARGIGIGPTGQPKAKQILLAAVVESPKGNLIIQLHGPQATVSAQRAAFMAFVKGLRPARG